MRGLDDGPDGLNDAAFDRALGGGKTRRSKRTRLEVLCAMVPMWSVSGEALGDRLYKHFSGHSAEKRAQTFALANGCKVTPGMGNRGGWLSLDAYREQLSALLPVGREVDYCSIIGGPVTTRGLPIRTGPQQLASGEWVVWLSGKAGCVSVQAVRP